MKITATLLALLGTATFAFAGGAAAPEIDASTAAGAIALVSGGLLVLRGRRGK